MLRRRRGFRLATALLVPGLLGAALCAVPGRAPVAAAAPAAAPAKPAARRGALPDSVVVRLPHRDLTRSEIEATWTRLEPRYRPPGTGLERARAFVDQLIEKEAMARAATAEPFTMTAPESARFLAFRRDLERQELFRLLVADSARVTAADRDSARRAAAAGAGDSARTPSPEAVEREALRLARQRRTEEVEARIRADLAPAWDDSVAALLARGYAAVGDTTLPDLDNPFSAVLKDRRPRVAAADTARTLVSSTAGTVTVAEFVRRFAVLNPFQSPLPTTAGAVRARGEQFLGQMWFDAEAARRDLASRPALRTALAERRESIALDHWYARHVAARIDTSEAALRAHYDKDPARFGSPAHALIHHWVVPARTTADSLVAALAADTPWDSVCARFAASDRERGACANTFTIADDTPDSALVATLRQLAPGRAYVRSEPPGAGFRVVQLVERNPARVRPFEEVRTFVGRDLAAVQAEQIVAGRMKALVEAMPKTVNAAALARLRLEP